MRILTQLTRLHLCASRAVAQCRKTQRNCFFCNALQAVKISNGLGFAFPAKLVVRMCQNVRFWDF